MKTESTLCFIMLFLLTHAWSNGMELKVLSNSFQQNSSIPKKHAYTEQNVSPHLSWSAGPSSTKSYMIICKDPDAPTPQPWLHWLMFDIPTSVTSVNEKQNKQMQFANMSKQAMNDYSEIGYGGPNPPSGKHRYYFHVYALDIAHAPLKIDVKVNQKTLDTFLKKHAVGHGVLMGTYEAKK